ncbi:MAG: hypothetical protein ABFS37_14055, partial [Acidobacteriota bacterium]
MHRWITVLFATVAAALLVGCGAEPLQSADDAYGSFRDAIREVETPEEKTALCEDFLKSFPKSEHTGSLAGAVAYYRGIAMGDEAGAVKVLDEILAEVDDPETRFEVELAQFPLAHKIGQTKDLQGIVSRLQANRALTFGEYTEVGEMAAEHELWDLAETQAAGASTVASAEA